MYRYTLEILWDWFQTAIRKWILQQNESYNCLVPCCIEKLCLHYTVVCWVCNNIMSKRQCRYLPWFKNALLVKKKKLTIIWNFSESLSFCNISIKYHCSQVTIANNEKIRHIVITSNMWHRGMKLQSVKNAMSVACN